MTKSAPWWFLPINKSTSISPMRFLDWTIAGRFSIETRPVIAPQELRLSPLLHTLCPKRRSWYNRLKGWFAHFLLSLQAKSIVCGNRAYPRKYQFLCPNANKFRAPFNNLKSLNNHFFHAIDKMKNFGFVDMAIRRRALGITGAIATCWVSSSSSMALKIPADIE